MRAPIASRFKSTTQTPNERRSASERQHDARRQLSRAARRRAAQRDTAAQLRRPKYSPAWHFMLALLTLMTSSATKITLYTHTACPFAQRVWIALEHTQVEFVRQVAWLSLSLNSPSPSPRLGPSLSRSLSLSLSLARAAGRQPVRQRRLRQARAQAGGGARRPPAAEGLHSCASHRRQSLPTRTPLGLRTVRTGYEYQR